MNKTAEELRSGMVFRFRGRRFVCLSSFTDTRHTQTVVTCYEWLDKSSFTERLRVVVLRVVRKFVVSVEGLLPLTFEVLENTKEEVLAL